MTALLTLNGIPPQIVGSINDVQEMLLREYLKDEENNEKAVILSSHNLKITYSPVRPFSEIVSKLRDSFTKWGATIKSELYHTFISNTPLILGETTFRGDFNLHHDKQSAQNDLNENNVLVLRVLCASSAPAHFIDLTQRQDMTTILDEQRISIGSRVFNESLYKVATEKGGTILVPKDWDIVVFDAGTPHLPQPAIEPNRRILMNAWYNLSLPDNWRDRVRAGDVPYLPIDTNEPYP